MCWAYWRPGPGICCHLWILWSSCLGDEAKIAANESHLSDWNELQRDLVGACQEWIAVLSRRIITPTAPSYTPSVVGPSVWIWRSTVSVVGFSVIAVANFFTSKKMRWYFSAIFYRAHRTEQTHFTRMFPSGTHFTIISYVYITMSTE